MNPIDTYRDAFLKFLAQGMTHAEAYREFCPIKLNRAVFEECITENAEWSDSEQRIVTNSGKVSLLELCSKAMREIQDEQDMQQATELWLSGWTSEIPESYRNNSPNFWRQCPVMSLQWRRPSRRQGKPGKRYLSTNQAWMSMQRETP